FPVDHLDDYIKESLPSYRDATQNPKIVADLVALIDKLGPCILLGWSTGTSNVMNAAAQRPSLVKAVIGIEGAPPAGGVDVNTLAKIPLVVLFGDNTSPANSRVFTDQLRALGDDASTIWPPKGRAERPDAVAARIRFWEMCPASATIIRYPPSPYFRSWRRNKPTRQNSAAAPATISRSTGSAAATKQAGSIPGFTTSSAFS